MWTCPVLLDFHESDIVQRTLSAFERPREHQEKSDAAAFPTRSNVHSGNSMEVDTEILALHMKAKGLLHPELQRRQVVKSLVRKLKSMNPKVADAPWRCPSVEATNLLLHRSLLAETVFTNLMSSLKPRLTAGHRFQKAISTHKFCNLRIEQVLRHLAANGDFLECLKQSGAITDYSDDTKAKVIKKYP